MRAPGRTLMSRIVWTTTVVSAIAMAAMIGTVLLALSALDRNSIDARLTNQLAAVSSTLTIGTDGTLTELDTADATIDDTTWVYAADGTLLDAPRAGRQVTRVVDDLADVRTRRRFDRFEHAFLAAPVTIEGKVRAVVVVETSLEPYESTRNNVLVGLVALGITVTAGSAAVAAWTVRRTLVPVESMATRAEDWSEHDLDSRFDVSGSDDEFARLGKTLNVLLDRVAGALRNEQQLTSELAHELRTPLTAIRGEAELTMMGEIPPQARERQQRVVQVVDRMSESITSLLAVARGDHGLDGRTSAAELVAEALDHAAVGEGPRVDTTGVGDLEIAAPADLALRALAPLVDNARRHAASTVTITASASSRSVRLDVSDDGAGITAADPDSLFQSGVHDSTSGGAGLGLALSRRVARTLGGDVTISSVSGPTTFTVTLPRP